MSVALQVQPRSPHPFTPRKMQSHLPNPSGLGHSAPPVSPHTPGKYSSGYTTPSSGSSQVSMSRKPSITAATRESKKRRDMKMRVVTQPETRSSQRNSQRWGPNMGRNRASYREPLPENATDLLTKLYEALIMAKNCEVPLLDFWSRFDLVANKRRVQYTMADIEHTLSTVGVECNTQVNGKQTTTGRWLLLRHKHFLLRAAHTVQWIDNPDYNPYHPSIDPQHPAHASFIGNPARESVPVVWDWKSHAEKWRWGMWALCNGMTFAPGKELRPADDSVLHGMDIETSSQTGIDWDVMHEDGIYVGESISAEREDIREMPFS